jgi:hypothetical protein
VVERAGQLGDIGVAEQGHGGLEVSGEGVGWSGGRGGAGAVLGGVTGFVFLPAATGAGIIATGLGGTHAATLRRSRGFPRSRCRESPLVDGGSRFVDGGSRVSGLTRGGRGGGTRLEDGGRAA